MEQMHRLLKRQLRRHFGDQFSIPEEWEGFVNAVNDAYRESDTDRGMLERSLELSSQELLQANSELRALFRAIPDLMFRLDSAGRILACEAGDTTHLFLQPEELVGRLIQDVPLESVGEEFRTAIHRVQETKSIVNIEYWMRLPDREHCYEARLLPLLEDQIIVIIRDMTERKRAEEALKESEERFRAIFDQTFQFIGLMTTDGILIEANRAALELYGIEESDVLGKPFWETHWWTHSPEQQDRLREAVRRAAAGEFVRFEAFHRVKEGDVRYVDFSIKPVRDDAGNVRLLIPEGRDITERKRAEEQRLAHLRFLENMDRIERSMSDARTLEQMMSRVLETALSIFDCDRAWLLYPCDPDAESCRVPIEHTRPEYPGAFERGRELPVTPGLAAGFQAALESKRPMVFRPGAGLPLPDFAPEYSVKSLINCALFPKTGKPWLWGLHQCSYARIWTQEDQRLFQEIGNRISDSLNSMLLFRDLQESEERYRSLMEAAPDPVVVYDTEGRVTYLNPAFTSVFGWTLEERLGKKMDGFIPDEMMIETSAAIDRIMAGESAVTLDTRRRTKDGRILEIEVRASTFKGSDGKVIGTMVIHRDVTEKRIMEKALEESREEYKELYEQSRRTSELYRTLLDASPDPVVVYDIKGIPLYVSPAFTRVFGWTFNELAGRRIDFVPPENWPETREMIDKVLSGEGFSNVETRRYTKDGRIIDVILSGAIFFDKEDRPAGSVIHLRDITERKLLEEQFRQATKMEAVGRLAGGVAHDFNNLLTVMLGYSKLLVQQLPKESPYYDKLAQINLSASRAAALTQQLLAFSRKQMLEVKVLDINRCISDMEEMLGRLIGEDIEIRTFFAPDLGRIEADPTQIEQILMNLAINARDEMPKGGILTIETKNVILDEGYARTHSEVQPGPHVMFAVSDTGSGMDAETLSRIFEPFFSTKAKGEGTGLGLSTVYGIVKQHNGHITVYSEPGIGTTFKVYFPLVAEPAEPRAGDAVAFPEGAGKETVLVVEDEELVRDLAADILQMLGYSVLKAADPDEAVKMSLEHEAAIHLLLTDVVLPRMDGRSLFDLLSRTRPEMKVLYTSGYTNNAIVHHGVLDKDVHFLPKPFTMDTLASKVREVLDEPR